MDVKRSTPVKRYHIFLVKKRFHALFTNGPLEFRVGFMIMQKWIIPHAGCLISPVAVLAQ